MSYAKFVRESMDYYGRLPYEPNPLYTRYAADLGLDAPVKSAPVPDPSISERIVSDTIEKTRLKFDVVITDSECKCTNPDVSVLTPEEAYERVLVTKLFKSSEEKLAAYVNAKATRFIIIDAPENSSRSANLLFVGNAPMSIEIMIRAGRKSKVSVSELHLSTPSSKSIMSSLHEISAEDDSTVEFNAFYNHSENANVLELTKAEAKDRAKINANFIFSGGNVVKSRNLMNANGINGSVNATELVFSSKKQQFDINTEIINGMQKSSAYLDSGAILDGMSKCAFKGFARVKKGAKGAVSRITEKGILLNETAHMDALPDMEIDYSNDVKATHAASTAPINREVLFYLNSRGLNESEAKELLISAFVTKYVSRMSDSNAKEIAMSVLLDKLNTGRIGSMPEISMRNVWVADNV